MKINYRHIWLKAFFLTCIAIQVKAGVETYTDMIRMTLDGQDVMVGVVTATTDYSTSYYYQGSVNVDLARIEDGNEVAVMQGYSWSQNPAYFQAEAILPYVASGDYSIEGNHQIEAFYSPDYNVYYDPYDYNYFNELYLNGFPAWHPLSYSFLGGGSSSPITSPSMVLGLIYAYREAAAQNKSSIPHHLKVDKDVTASHSDCTNNVRRLVTYVIVDEAGKNAGKKVIHRERFDPPFKDVVCFQSGEFPEPTTCSAGVLGSTVYHTAGNPFTDRLTAGCRYTDPSCGFTVDKQRHYWCTHVGPGPTYIETPIAKMITEARTKEVKVDGQVTWTKGKEFFP